MCVSVCFLTYELNKLDPKFNWIFFGGETYLSLSILEHAKYIAHE